MSGGSPPPSLRCCGALRCSALLCIACPRVLSAQSIVLLIAGLATPQWFNCNQQGGPTVEWSLQTIKASNGAVQLSEDACSSDAESIKMNDVPCTSGRAALGLGVVAILLAAGGTVMSIAIATGQRKRGLWTGALLLQIFASVLAIIAGAGYIGLMAAKSADAYSNYKPSITCAAETGPILLIVGGLLAIAAASMHCLCCCDTDQAEGATK